MDEGSGIAEASISAELSSRDAPGSKPFFTERPLSAATSQKLMANLLHLKNDVKMYNSHDEQQRENGYFQKSESRLPRETLKSG